MNNIDSNVITIKVELSKSVPLNEAFYLDIINALNDKLIPCNEISVNDKKVFDSNNGFVKE